VCVCVCIYAVGTLVWHVVKNLVLIPNKSVALGMQNVVWRLSTYISFPLFYVLNVVGKPTLVRNLMKRELYQENLT
jgi:hypothetical protein